MSTFVVKWALPKLFHKSAFFALAAFLCLVELSQAAVVTIANASFEQDQLYGVTRPAYRDNTPPGTNIETNVFYNQVTGQYFAYNYLTAPTAAGPNNPGLDASFLGNINGSLIGPNQDAARAPQAFIYQTTGGVGPFIRVVPNGGWTLSRANNSGAVFNEASGQFASTIANAGGGTSNLNNEDSFLQANTEATSVAGRFFTNGLNPIDPDGGDPDNLPDLNVNASAWQADGQNVLVVRNRSNRVQVGGANPGRGVVMSQLLSDSVIPGYEYTLSFQVGDRIGALAMADYDVIVRAGGLDLFSANSVADTSLRPVNDNGLATPNTGSVGAFTTITRTFTAPANASGALEISFGVGGLFAGVANNTAGTGDGLIAFDNFRLNVIPEPASFLLASLALSFSVLSRRYRLG